MDADAAWRLHPQVSVRPEPFGALLYHFGTRKLSFLKDRTLLELVDALGESDSAVAACDRVGIPVDDRPRYLRALATLEASAMIEERAA
ncbi:mycofactocin biosynthesis chaperone MftB [Microbacterium sp. X-17]|uniref:mycofactocin biosynthesis chaperone MftB n=1 Tax=Microbacterium sp. X-17 TaxID=3144404 RepID=UPI0031F50083